MFLAIPDYWYDKPGPKYRCVNGHVSTCILKSESKGDLCLECYGPLMMTFPNDKDGPMDEMNVGSEPMSCRIPLVGDRDFNSDLKRLMKFMTQERITPSYMGEATPHTCIVQAEEHPGLLIHFVERALGEASMVNLFQASPKQVQDWKNWFDYCFSLFQSVEPFL